MPCRIKRTFRESDLSQMIHWLHSGVLIDFFAPCSFILSVYQQDERAARLHELRRALAYGSRQGGFEHEGNRCKGVL